MFPDASDSAFQQVSLSDLPQVAKKFLESASGYKVWLFHGEMGAGKTTFIKAICTALGVKDTMSSPTFSIVNEYVGNGGEKVFHFDFFRIKNEAEAYDIGVEDYFYSGNFCFIEWPEKIPTLIPSEHIEIQIALENETYRTIALSVHDGKEKNGI